MTWDINSIDRWFRNALIVITGILMALQVIFGDENAWLNGAMILIMAGVVGYFTNLLALKMLFQPKQGSVLGWSGLVPKNKHLIAERLGESIQNQLLSPDIIMGYVNERNMIELGTQRLEQWLDATLQDAEFRKRINTRLVAFLQERGPDLLRLAFDFSEGKLKAMARNPDLVAKNWQPLRTRLVALVQTEDNRRMAVDNIRKLMLEQLPQLAHALNDAINTYLERKNAMGLVGKQLKSFASFDQHAIQDLLERFVNDEATQEQLIGVVDILIENLQQKLDAPETQAFLEAKIGGWVENLSGYARDQWLPQAIASLQVYLADEANWHELDRYLTGSLTWSKEKLSDYINSEEGQAWVKRNIEQLVQRLNVTGLVQEQVMKLDTDELEKMILDNTGGNLVVIQVLGGVLGLIVGTIQVNVWFAIPVFLLTGIVWVLAYFNQRKYQPKV